MTTTTQHTPGPLTYGHSGMGTIGVVIKNGTGKIIGTAHDVKNAKLWCNSQELLEACKEVLVEWQAKVDLMPQIIDSAAIRLVKQAVARAEGR